MLRRETERTGGGEEGKRMDRQIDGWRWGVKESKSWMDAIREKRGRKGGWNGNERQGGRRRAGKEGTSEEDKKGCRRRKYINGLMK